MGEIASQGQIRMAGLRWGIVLVPLVLLLGLASGRLSNSGYGNGWFAALAKPGFTPPGWMFGVAWSLLYLMMGVALVMIVSARGARGRGRAIGLFAVQLALNLAWSPLFFAAHRIWPAFVLILLILGFAAATAWAFWNIRRAAGLLMLPYLAWLCLAAALNFEIGRMNPAAAEVAQMSRNPHVTA
ncbi:TspO/MBR family protein [Sphingomonas montana]|uniref:TspO/MBR family protein n=1 Tax=Sphingomonas montana TaxID=1843236 RepID=UPI00096D6640|nr:TspO/MBR family protein [Sphingomonas montana]